MRRSEVVAVVGAAVAGAGALGYALVNRGVVTDAAIAGVRLQQLALVAIAVGVALLIGGVVFTQLGRRRDAAAEDLAVTELAEAEEAQAAEEAYVWPRIVVRSHGRPRRAMAQVVSLPPPALPSVPSPQHPSMVAGVAARTVPPAPIDTGDGWLPDNVQRLPYRL